MSLTSEFWVYHPCNHPSGFLYLSNSLFGWHSSTFSTYWCFPPNPFLKYFHLLLYSSGPTWSFIISWKVSPSSKLLKCIVLWGLCCHSIYHHNIYGLTNQQETWNLGKKGEGGGICVPSKFKEAKLATFYAPRRQKRGV